MLSSVPTFCIVLIAPAFAYDFQEPLLSQPVRRYGLKTRASPPPHHAVAPSSLKERHEQLSEHIELSNSVHCVVWGEEPVEGMNFISKEEAGRHFEQVKKVDVVALHFDANMHELQRYVSPRLLNVKYNALSDWCKTSKPKFLATLHAASNTLPKGGHRSAAAMPAAFGQIEKAAAPNHDPDSMDLAEAAGPPSETADDQAFAPLDDLSAPLPLVQPNSASADTGNVENQRKHPPNKHHTHWTASTSAEDTLWGSHESSDSVALSSYEEPSVPVSKHDDIWSPRTSPSVEPAQPYIKFAPETSSLTEKVAAIEQEFDGLRSNTNALLAKIGVDGKKIASILQKPHRQVPLNKVKGETDSRKVTARVQDMIELIPEMQGKVNILEEEIHGATQEEPSAEQLNTSPVKFSLKKKVEQLVVTVDALRKRMYDVDIMPYLGDIDLMERIADQHKPNLIKLAKLLGVTPMDSHVGIGGTKAPLKSRINMLERYVSEAHRGTIELENELVENARSQAALLEQGTKQSGIKERIEALKKDFENLKKRHLALNADAELTKLEALSTGAKKLSTSVNQMVSKIGIDITGPTTQLKGLKEPIKEQISALEGLVSDMHRKLFALEEELAGSGSKFTTDLPRARGAKAKINALERTLQSLITRNEDLKGRM